MRKGISLLNDFDRSFTSWWPMISHMDKLFNEVSMGTPLNEDFRVRIPACDIEDKEDHYVLSFDMPGIDKENIEIDIAGDRIKVSGNQKQSKEDKKNSSQSAGYHLRMFERIMTLPTDINKDRIEAEYRNGQLLVAIPKLAETVSQKIKISDGKSKLFQKIFGDSTKKDQDSVAINSPEEVSSH